MSYDQELISGKLKRWDHYLTKYQLPSWDLIPDIGLYMEQVIDFLKQILDYIPVINEGEEFITPAAINNYVRRGLMPKPINKRYYRVHLAYLIIICTLKESLSSSSIATIIPADLSEEDIKSIYKQYVKRHELTIDFFLKGIRSLSAGIMGREVEEDISSGDTHDLIISVAIMSGYSRVLAEKLLLLNNKTLEDGGSIEIRD